MRSLRFLWGSALAVMTWALVMLCWLVPVRAQAGVPQAPAAPTILTVSAQNQKSTLALTGSLTSQGQPIKNAVVTLTLDKQDVGQATTGSDGTYSASTNLPSFGPHVVIAKFAGDPTYRAATATTNFLYIQPSAPTTTAPPPTLITATLTPSPVAAGSVLSVTGNVSSNGTPVDSSRVDISCDFGGTSMLGVTDASGNFTASLALPASGQPAKLTVTVNFGGDNRFAAAKATFQAPVTAAAPSTAAVAPSTAPESSAPPASEEPSPSAAPTSAPLATSNDSTPSSTFAIVLGIVGVGSTAALCVLWVLAWRRHDLLPGERRGFGSDFGRRRPSL